MLPIANVLIARLYLTYFMFYHNMIKQNAFETVASHGRIALIAKCVALLKVNSKLK